MAFEQPADPAPTPLTKRPPQTESPLHSAVVLTTAIVGILMQVWLVWVGADLLWGPDHPNDPDDLTVLLTWCIIATVYLGATAITLSVKAQSPHADSQLTRTVIGHPLSRLLSVVFTFGASLIGLVVAIDIITDLGHDRHDTAFEAAGVWAMMLAWVMFNWGYARIYFSLYHRAKVPPLAFPGTDDPRLVDFAYLAFTNATNFSVSDVQVLSTRMRWTIVWHTTLAFFFNALIIGLIINVLANGKLLADFIS
ncbi:putative membrane protein [Leucobacter exalbidus]|uniref:Membrane protein n=1 Tax=Leucobacter exalbidus TaxID=662960 RepID=A0A940PMP8_9MICO|nr:DUF1345 domain-containing protein [Leucobacter exalbidus]MBP1326782.1 putative membrane protein [Leucobacter exalbidus]